MGLQDIIAILGMDELSEDDKLTVARAQDRALPLAAVPRRRDLHRQAGQVRLARPDYRRLQGAAHRPVRRPARAGLLHGGADRGGGREGGGDGEGGRVSWPTRTLERRDTVARRLCDYSKS